MTTFVGPPNSAIRNKPISTKLKQVLEAAARAAEIEMIRITSGGQDALGEGTRRTGSTRHDRGRAADLQLVVDGTTLSFTDQSAPAAIRTFVTAAAAAGATGIGAGVRYMGDRTIHVGFGTSTSDVSEITWGAGGHIVNAPRWLQDATKAGWSEPTDATSAAKVTGRFVVLARNGLKLRGGPGTNFEELKELDSGSQVNVVGYSDFDPAWAQVSLEDGDELMDGYVFASFLGRSDANSNPEDAPEPDSDEDA